MSKPTLIDQHGIPRVVQELRYAPALDGFFVTLFDKRSLFYPREVAPAFEQTEHQPDHDSMARAYEMIERVVYADFPTLKSKW